MESNVNYTLVGAFMLVLITAIVLAIIWLSSGFDFNEYKIYKIYMQESVSGLTPESTVEFNGVNVGKILKMRINHDNPSLIELLINIKQSTPVTSGTSATLSMRGLTGIVYLALQDKGTNLAPLGIPPDENYPVIRTTPSFITRLDLALTTMTDSMTKLSQSMQNLLSKENLDLLRKILNNTNISTKELIPLLRNGTKTITNADQTAIEIGRTAQSVSEMSNEIKQNPAVLIRGKTPAPLGPGEK